MLRNVTAALCAAASILSATVAFAEEAVPEAAREALRLTIYRNGFALVSDRRTLPLRAGTTRLRVEGVPATLHLDSVLLRADGTDLALQAVRYEAATPTAATLLQQAVGRIVRLARVNPATGEQTEVEAEVLSAGPGGPVYRIDGRIEVDYPGRLILDRLPPDLRLRPALLLDVDGGSAQAAPATLHYLADGLGWDADYAVVLAPSRERVGLTGYVTLRNGTDTAFRDAQVDVVAGDLNRVSPGQDARAESAEAPMMMRAMAAPDMPKRQSLGDYHLYGMPRSVTLAPGQAERTALLSTDDVPARVHYALYDTPPVVGPLSTEGADRRPVSVRLVFDNQDPGPDMPLPEGVARVYVADAAGALRLLGEDRLAATPMGEDVELQLGRSFDVTAERRQTSFSRVGERITESGHEIVLANARDRSVTVEVHETMRGEWDILQSSLPHQKADATTVVWRVEVPAGGRTTLGYRVRSRL
ncbi:MAG: hypothetical protein WD270_10195 [Acetobacterales bacterium]